MDWATVQVQATAGDCMDTRLSFNFRIDQTLLPSVIAGVERFFLSSASRSRAPRTFWRSTKGDFRGDDQGHSSRRFTPSHRSSADGYAEMASASLAIRGGKEEVFLFLLSSQTDCLRDSDLGNGWATGLMVGREFSRHQEL
jgi:hypothetical protein